MKSIKLFVLIISLLYANLVIGQSGLNFQGVARNENGVILASQEMSLRLSIVQGSATGAVEFSEIRKTTTNAQGLFSVVIGGSNALSTLGNFNAIDWKLAPKFLKIEMDITGGENFTLIGTTQLQSVAYAKYAEYVDATNINGIVPVSKGGTGKNNLEDFKIALNLNEKANLASPAFTGTVTGITKTMVGLGDVDNTTDLNKPISTSTQTALDLKASIIQLNTKEELANKSTSVATDAASDIKYPSAKAVKTFVDNAILSGVPDATDAIKGKILLAGALTGTASLPAIANNTIGTDQLLDVSVSDAKIISVTGSKISGDITGNANNITGVATIANGGTGANNASTARTNLGLTIGTNVEFPLTVTGPLTRVSNAIGLPVASSSVNGYLASTDWTNFNNKMNASEKGANNGIATLDASGKIPSVQIPAISFQSANVVASQSAMLALSNAVEGSIAIRTDNSKNYVLSTTPASTLSNWIELATPTSVTSVNGFAGPNVSLTTDNITEGSTNKYFTNTQARNAISATAPLTYDASSGGIALPRASTSQDGYITSGDWNSFNNKQGSLTAGTGVTISSNTISIGQNVGTTATPTFASVNGIKFFTNKVTSIGIGLNSLQESNTGAGNIALGVGTLYNNTSGSHNVALGNSTLYFNTTGFYNIGIGNNVLNKNITGSDNVGLGVSVLFNNTSGTRNTSSGSLSMYLNTTGAFNTAVGLSALYRNKIGNKNTAIGTMSDVLTEDLTNATAIGYGAIVSASNSMQLGDLNLQSVNTSAKLTTGSVTYPNEHGASGQVLSTTGSGTLTWTTLTGVSSQTITTTSLNSPFDFEVLTGYNGSSLDIRTAENLANGEGSLVSNTDGIANVAVGIRTLKNNTIGSANTALGFESLFNNSTGQNNTGIGTYTLRSNTTGNYNTAVGSTALLSNTIGVNNASLGEWALLNNISGSRNTAHGANTIMKNTTGNSNTGIGFNALFNSIDGNRNTAVGEGALYTLTNGSFNTTLGYAADVAFNNLNNATAIGYYAQVTASNSIQLGNGNITDVKTAGKLTTGAVTYPNLHGTNGQVLSTTGTGTLTWTTPTTTDLSNITGVLSIAKGGTGTSTQNFVDLNTNQTVSGFKTFSNGASFNGVYIGIGNNSTGTLATTNLAIGPYSLNANTTGTSNISIGQSTLAANISGSYNSGIGYNVLSYNTTGNFNAAVGFQSMFRNTSGSLNTATGVVSLNSNTTGVSNTAIGYSALATNTIGNNNTAVGHEADVASNNLNNATAIGNGAIVNTSNTIQLGNTDITDVKTAGKLTTGTVTYPNIDGINGQILSTTGSGTLTWTTPTTTDLSNITGVLSIAKGGTGTSTQNFVDLTADQTIAGNKTFSSGALSIGLSNRGSSTSSIAFPSADDPAFISHYTAGNIGRMFFSAGDDATVDYFAFGYGLLNSFTEKLKIYADGRLTAPVDANINGLTIGKGNNSSLIGNTIIGNTALASNSVGQYNTAIGNTSMRFNISGNANTAVGNEALQSNTSGSLNIAVGANALQTNTSGSENTVVGNSAMYLNTTGAKNTALGYYALRSNTIGAENTATGDMALYANTEGNFNTANGSWALYANNVGSYNTSFGHNSTTYNTSGNRNTSVGAFSLYKSTNANNNTSIGAYALQNNNTGSGNTSTGANSMYDNSIGEYNTANGFESLKRNTSGTNNTSIGAFSGLTNSTGNDNTSIGASALYAHSTGNFNTAVGSNALFYDQTGVKNTAIGYKADVASPGLTNATAIGSEAVVGESNTIALGNPFVTKVITAGTLTAGTVTYPNTHGTSGQILTTTGSGTLTWTASVTHYVGEVYGGGIVFYVYDNGQHGLIASTSDQAVNIRWNAGTNTNTIALADGLGAGKKNTATIIASQGYGDGQTYAARACNEYSVTSGGITYGDWYLPSKYELNLLRDAKNVVGNFYGFFYWSSTEINQSTAWGQYFDTTTLQSAGDKVSYDTNRVRAIRSF